MRKVKRAWLSNGKLWVGLVTMLMSLGATHSVLAINLSQTPLFLSQPVRPIVMLNMSNDHQLFYKVYDDYSDLDDDGELDITYNNDIEYYGYFNSDLCYGYSNNLFSPSGFASEHYCSGSNWSGNFLNWASMTRMDVVRKILYGGKRFVDTEDQTILERAFLPQDAHSFAKYYNGTDLNKLTPFGVTSGLKETELTGITICNTTEPNSRDNHSQDVIAPPLMRVAKGNFSLWASNERWQCRWDDDEDVDGQEGLNNNDPKLTGIYAYPESPSKADDGLGEDEYTVRIESCVDAYVDEEDNVENCRGYAGGNIKPAGLLQAYGEDDSIMFGLITGSYNKNKSGGVLRKNVGSMTDEINVEDGTFISPDEGAGIVDTLDAMRIVGYNFSPGHYNNLDDNSDRCPWAKSSFNNGSCTNWGNPQSEIYLESLRYLAGLKPTDSFNANDSTKLDVLSQLSWEDPVDEDNFCSPLSVIQFNASTSSYDGDELSGASSIGLTGLSAITNKVGASEGISGGQFFVGATGAGDDQLCTPKTVSGLASVSGTCPDAPRLEGSYQIAGLAYHARTEGIKDGRETVQTFGVALAPAVPKIEVPVPGSGRSITILPACRNLTLNPAGNCAIVDFKIIEQDHSGGINRGRVYVNWEDSEQGGDYDQDMWGILAYEVNASEATIATQVIAQSSGDKMGFGYVINGTTQDGFHAHSGINDFTYDEIYADVDACGADAARCYCRNGHGICDNAAAAARAQTYQLGGSPAKLLEQPLYYAAKWGGFDDEDDNGNKITEPQDDTNPTYFYATEPRELEKSLDEALKVVAEGIGAAASVATNSTRLSTDSYLFQATFNSQGWYGELRAIQIGEDGSLGSEMWNAGTKLSNNASDRVVLTSNGSKIVDFDWANLTPDQSFALNNQGGDDLGEERVLWLRGNNVNGLREREVDKRLGDIVNSDPVFFGKRDYGFTKLSEHGGNHYGTYVKSKSHEIVYVQANDGKLHAFNAQTGVEVFAYVPNGIYDKLPKVTAPNYGSSVNQHVFLADGQTTVGDVYNGSEWRTILVAGLGAGGEGAFVLDVTEPTDPKLIHEFTSADVGHVTGKPAIVPLPNGRWAVVIPNGYKSGSNNTAKLLVGEVSGGSLSPIHVMDTGVGGDNGLSEPEFTINGAGAVDRAYAGDLQGNMWRFDLSAPSDKKSVSKLFAAGPDQPITAAPTLGLNFLKRDPETAIESVMVYFGTGRYLSDSDLNPDNAKTQSFYGIADTGVTLTRIDLHENIISQTGATRTVHEAQAEEALDWASEDVHGWYVDFPENGERVTAKAMLMFDRLVFPTMVPTDNMCDFGGVSWIMVLTGVGDMYQNYQLFEEQGTEVGTMVTITGPIMPPTPTPPGPEDDPDDSVDDCAKAAVIVQQSDGTLLTLNPCLPAGALGRQSWRQFR